jgi:4-amino-4-deoxy-L-arabinose transferase-like glycosyltransferase
VPFLKRSADPLWWIAGGFLAIQGFIIWLATNGPFVDEGLYTVAGLRVLEGKGLADGYLRWFNGSPFAWPVIAAVGHHLGGLSGARFMAAISSTVTLVAVAKTAENLFGRSAATWCALAFGVNGLFLALAHFAVYDVAALTGLAVSMWCVTRSSASRSWLIVASIAFAGAVITKYGHMLMVVPLLGLLVAVHGVKSAARALAVFLTTAGVILAAYFWLSFGSLFPTSSAAYLEQTFGRSRGHIAVLQIIFGFVPFALASVGAVEAWRRRRYLLVVTCLLALALYPVFHLWTANFVSGQKHVVAGFLFAYPLAGVALEWLWTSRSRMATVGVLVGLTLWGGFQCYWQDHSWSDIRPLARHLVQHMARGDRIVAESSWSYTLYLYPRGLIESPAEVRDANYAPAHDRLDVCQIPWVVGNPDSGELVRRALERCPHHLVLSSSTRHYYFDTTRLRLAAYSAVVGLYRLPRS